MIRALIFDMDGTLLDSEILHYEAWKEALAPQGGTEKSPFIGVRSLFQNDRLLSGEPDGGKLL